MSGAHDRYEQQRAIVISDRTRRIVQDGTALDTISAAVESTDRTELQRDLLRTFVALYDAGELRDERPMTARRAHYARLWATRAREARTATG